MKKLIIIFFIVYIKSWSQDYKSPEYQKEMFEKANEYLTNSEYMSAAGVYQYVNELNPNNNLGKISLKKSDSLRPIARQRLKESLIGTWKLSEKGSNWGMEKTINITTAKILIVDENNFWFYEQNLKNSEMKLIKSEVMKFSVNAHWRLFSYEFVFSDNQIWNISKDPKKDTLRLTNTGEEKGKDRTEIVCGNLEMIYTRVKE